MLVAFIGIIDIKNHNIVGDRYCSHFNNKEVEALICFLESTKIPIISIWQNQDQA